MTPEQQKALLELLPTADLIEEMMGRYDHAIFYGLKDNDPPTTSKTFSQRFKGEMFICLGACSRLAHEINLHLAEQERDISPDDL